MAGLNALIAGRGEARAIRHENETNQKGEEVISKLVCISHRLRQDRTFGGQRRTIIMPCTSLCKGPSVSMRISNSNYSET